MAIWKTTKDKIDRTACAIVKMERGEYEFPDGKPRFHKTEDGRRVPRVIRAEAQRCGWELEPTTQISSDTYYDLFNEKGKYHQYLNQRIVYHRQRLEGGFQQALAELTGDGEALAVMSGKLYESLFWDLNDEATAKKIPFRDRAKFLEALLKLTAAVKSDAASRGQQPVQVESVVNVINVPESVREQLRAKEAEIEAEVVEEKEGGEEREDETI